MARKSAIEVGLGEGVLGRGRRGGTASGATEGRDRLGWLVGAGPKARYVLAVIRIVNGAVALVAPSVIIKRFGENPGQSAAAIYGLRLFGVRTVLIGADLLTQRGQPLVHTASQAVVIHASDTVTAARLGISGRLRPRMAIPLTLISTINTVLAIISWLASRRQDRS
jgi:hypothetical protein